MIGGTQTLSETTLCKEDTQNKSVIIQSLLRDRSAHIRYPLEDHSKNSESVLSRLEVNAERTRNTFRKQLKEHTEIIQRRPANRTEITQKSLVEYSEQLREHPEITQRSSIEQSGHKRMNPGMERTHVPRLATAIISTMRTPLD